MHLDISLLVKTTICSALVVSAAGTASAEIPDKNSDRAGWIKASFEGKQADFCGPVPSKKRSGPSDPDFVSRKILKLWKDGDFSRKGSQDGFSLANAICKFPGNPELQAKLMPLWNSWAKFYGFSRGDWADFSAALDPKTPSARRPQAIRNSRMADVKGAAQETVARSLLVTSYSMDFMSYAVLLDSYPAASEHTKLGFVEMCLRGYRAKGPGYWAICQADALSLSRKRIDAELAATTVNPRTRIRTKVRFVRAQKDVAVVSAQVRKLASSGGDLKKVVDSLPVAAQKRWKQESAAYLDTLAWTSKIEDDARADNRETMKGCEVNLRSFLGKYLKEKSPRTKEAMKNAFQDNIGSQLGSAAALCLERKSPGQTYWSEVSSGFAEIWGPRTMIWQAIVSAKIDSSSRIGVPKPVMLYSNSAISISEGTITKMKKSGDSVTLSFKKERWKQAVCKKWKETNIVSSIDPRSGKFTYRSRCVKTVMETVVSTTQDVRVSSENSKGLKVGRSARFARGRDGSGYPIALYASKKRKKIIGAFGVLF